MTAQHTPGPWIARPDPNSIMPDGWVTDNWCIGVEGLIDKVAVCSARDARLIAAAPDLLEALRKLHHALDECDMVHDDQRSAYANASAIIAKATGETK